MNGFEALAAWLEDAAGLLTSADAFGVTRWGLAAVFAIAGVSKLRRPALAALAMVDFGVTGRARPALGTALGAAEIALAASLMVEVVARPALGVAAVALWLFTVMLARSLNQGASFPCFCLGDSDTDISGRTLVRTTALALLASVQAWTAPPTATGGSDEAVIAVAGVSLVGAALLVARIPGLLRWNSDTRRPPAVEAA